MIELNGVAFRYGNEDGIAESETAVENINLRIKAGECVILCGRSGCGKSTIMRLVNGLAPSFYAGSLIGEISVGGISPSALSPEERTRLLGVVFQDPEASFLCKTSGTS